VKYDGSAGTVKVRIQASVAVCGGKGTQILTTILQHSFKIVFDEKHQTYWELCFFQASIRKLKHTIVVLLFQYSLFAEEKYV
jgi:hypothetical protein